MVSSIVTEFLLRSFKFVIVLLGFQTFNRLVDANAGLLNRGPRLPKGATSKGLLLNSSTLILQHPIAEQGATSVESLEGGHKP